MNFDRTSLLRCLIRPALAALVLGPLLAPHAAQAQAIAAVVNGDPITTTEVDEQMKFRRIVHEPATREQALEDLIGDRLKLRSANRNGIDATDASFAQALTRTAAQAKTTSNGLITELQNAKVNIELVRSHLRAVAAWSDFVKARYKALGVSTTDVDQALKTGGGAANADATYVLQPIVFVIPANASAAVVEQRIREAQALRNRFQDCDSGVPLARALPDVAIRPQVSKAANTLSETTRTALAQTQKGRLTAPDRTPSGIEMVAVCNRDDNDDRTSIRDTVRSNLLTERLKTESDRMYKELRATAVVEKR